MKFPSSFVLDGNQGPELCITYHLERRNTPLQAIVQLVHAFGTVGELKLLSWLYGAP